MFFIFKMLIVLFLCITSSNAKQVVSVKGEYSYGPSISQNEACNRAINGREQTPELQGDKDRVLVQFN